MKRILSIAIFSVLISSCSSIKSNPNDLAVANPINASLDLVNIDQDRVPVVINPGRFTTDTVVYRLPKVVQGTYDVSDFGSFIDNFTALDYDGNTLAASQLDTNSWQIVNATQLDKVSYLVNDTYDIEGGDKPTPFSPSGTNIEEENYVLNLHGFIGYFDTLKNAQYTLDISAPKDFVRTSALQKSSESLSEDGMVLTTNYFAPRYFDVTDNPMMFGNLDVEEFNVGDIKIVLSVYSPNGLHSAETLKETMYTMMEAQKSYLGDLDSTPRYDIYLYLADMQKEESPDGFGALEHHTSTVVVLPEQMGKKELDAAMIDVVAHEFFHIVTPLSVHSEDVHYFDYNSPTFSKHLWMYEGVTEYFAQHFQIYEGLVDKEKFLQTIMDKIGSSLQMDDSMSFTTMSENVLDEPYSSNYYNVYQKGALIGMCLDILLRENSGGQRSMLSLMKELSAKYGKNKPFEDDAILDEITAMTYPAIGEFFETHVKGTTPIDYSEFFEKVGLEFSEGQVKTNYIQNAGQLIIGVNPMDQTIIFNDFVRDNSFWSEQGAQPNDIIKSIDGTDISLENANDIFSMVYTWQPGRDIEVVLLREGEAIVIKTTTTQSYTRGQAIVQKDDATEQQLALQKAWLKG